LVFLSWDGQYNQDSHALADHT